MNFENVDISFIKILKAASVLISLIVPLSAYSDTPLGQIQRQQSSDVVLEQLKEYDEEQEVRRAKEEAKEEFDDAEDDSEQSSKESKGPEFLIHEIIVSESKHLDQQEILNITSPYIEKYVSVSDLQGVVVKLNRLYRKKGYIASKAILPPQKIKNGIVKIELIEGKIGDILFEGNGFIRSSYLKWLLDINKDEHIDLIKLEENLVRTNKNSVNFRVSTKMLPGKEYGKTDVVVRTREAPQLSVSFFTDNNGVEATGYSRSGFTVQGSFLGVDEQFIASSTQSKGVSSGFASLNIPVSRFGTRGRLIVSDSRQNIIGGEFAALNIKGKADSVIARLTHPLYMESKNRFFVEVEYAESNSENKYLSIDQRSEIKKTVLSLDYHHYEKNGFWSAKVQAHRISSSSSNNSINSDKSLDAKYSLHLTKVKKINDQLTFTGKFDGQFTESDILPSSEQFFLGGSNNLAYETSEFSGNDGYAVGLEANYKLNVEKYISNPLGKIDVSAFSKIQHGGIFPFRVDEEKGSKREDFANSFSVGLKSIISKRIRVNLTWIDSLDTIHKERVRDRAILFSGQIKF